jgi:nucleoside-diphosphate-sugar epimerase
MTTVLATGGTGFLGQNLVRALLADGCCVRVLVRPDISAQGRRTAKQLQTLGAELHVGDMSNLTALRAALRGVRQVFHLAGQLLVPGVPSEVYRRLHVDGTRLLLTACAEQDHLDAIVHCSTTGVLGPTGATLGHEDAPLRPSNIYEYTKAAGEQLALELAQTWSLPLSVARPALVYGPGDLHLLGWFRTIQRGVYRVVGRGANLLHPIYIDDLVDGLRRCAGTPAALGRIYHLVGERPAPISELAAAIATALGVRLPRRHLPAGLAWAGASALEALPGVNPAWLPLTRSRIMFMSESRAYCGERARRELGFTPRVDLATGLAQGVAWYRAEGLL